MSNMPRVAFLPDSFHEVNGAARTCRELEAYARRKKLPFFSVHYGPEASYTEEGELRILQLKRSRIAVPVDLDLQFDPVFYRNRKLVEEKLREFKPDLIHITSPGDAGILGMIAAAALHVPLVLSWHTNMHEFAARRLSKALRWSPGAFRERLAESVETFILDRTVWFFGRGEVLLAPSPELVKLLETRTGRRTLYMGRGVDTQQFSPDHRERDDGVFTIGFVGRLMPEKNVRFLAELEQALVKAGHTDFRIVMVGGGKEEDWLRENIKHGKLTGILHGEDLGREFANFDVFAFPSNTDTFGQVVQEAHASAVPTVVTSSGGPQFLVDHGQTGYVARNDQEFIDYVLKLKTDPSLRERMGRHARRQCVLKCWDRTFIEVYKAYELCKAPACAASMAVAPATTH